MASRIVIALFVVAGCGSQNSRHAKSTDDAQTGTSPESHEMSEGTTVCFGSVLGMRYPVEDALREQELEPVAECTFAEVRLEETGAPGGYALRYQKMGDGKWRQCDSKEQDRTAFLRECVIQMMDDLGGSASAKAATAQESEE